MQSGLARLGAAVALSLIVAFSLDALRPVLGQTRVAVTYFDESLATDGTWVWHPTYGRVWKPRQVGAEWRPYLYGRWVYTSEYGWVWVSEERWGWAVYHYGHWVWTIEHGWVWVPGTVWGPAWVEWCYGAGYVGWSPMPPDPYWRGAYYSGAWECSSPNYSSRWVYVSERNFLSARVSAHVVASAQAPLIARGAVNVTSYARVGSAIVNRSVDVTRLQAATGVPITPRRVVQAKQPTSTQLTSAQELRVYRPAAVAKFGPGITAPAAPVKPLDLDTSKDVLSPTSKDILSSPSPFGRSVTDPVPSAPSVGTPPVGGILRGGGGLLRR